MSFRADTSINLRVFLLPESRSGVTLQSAPSLSRKMNCDQRESVSKTKELLVRIIIGHDTVFRCFTTAVRLLMVLFWVYAPCMSAPTFRRNLLAPFPM